jgi:Zn-dependent protease with chaperone function
MMYWIRYAILSVGVFFLVYVALSGVLVPAWHWIKKHNLLKSSQALFTLRMLPLTGALLLVVLVTIPSFWSFEPPGIEEGVGLPAAVLFAAAAAWMLLRSARLFASWRKARYFFAFASPLRTLDLASELPAYELPAIGPNLFVAGVWRPKLLISPATVELLDAEEMRAAIRHEVAHAQSRDNLRQIIVRFCAFPLLASLDREWLRAAEVSADDRAVRDELGAAELASALIKVGTASARFSVPELGMSLVPEKDAPVSARVQRLLDWKPGQPQPKGRVARWCLLLAPLGAVAINHFWLMAQMHRFTELLFQ